MGEIDDTSKASKRMRRSVISYAEMHEDMEPDLFQEAFGRDVIDPHTTLTLMMRQSGILLVMTWLHLRVMGMQRNWFFHMTGMNHGW